MNFLQKKSNYETHKRGDTMTTEDTMTTGDTWELMNGNNTGTEGFNM